VCDVSHAHVHGVITNMFSGDMTPVPEAIPPSHSKKQKALNRIKTPAGLEVETDSVIQIIHSLINYNKKLSYCWETVRRESMPRIAEMDVEMTT